MISANAAASRANARATSAASLAASSARSILGCAIASCPMLPCVRCSARRNVPGVTLRALGNAAQAARIQSVLHKNGRNRSMSRKLLAGLALAATLAAGCAAQAMAQDPAKLNDLEIAHAAYVAGDIDIRNAHLALALSDDPKVREFAGLMIRDHEAVNQAALALLDKLKAKPQDNEFSQALLAGAHDTWSKMAKLSGAEFDKSYAANEVSYHQAVNKVVGESFIPNVENAELKTLLGSALDTFKAHEKHAEQMVAEIGS